MDEKISEYEEHALKALEKNEEALALEVAQKIADLESQKEQESLSGQAYETSAVSLRKVIRQTEQNLKRIKHQVDTVKATESVQRAQAAVAEKHSGTDSKMRTAMDSLERIKEKQALKAAQMSAAQEIAEDDVDANLQDKLERAGIRPSENSAEDVLARLKKK